MPELPEVETTRRGIEPWLKGQRVSHVEVRQRSLRLPVPLDFDEVLPGSLIKGVDRRAKYLLLNTEKGTVMLHLGMSGSLRLLDKAIPPGRHDHVDIVLTNQRVLRFTDPRRFGLLLWTTGDPERHRLLRNLGPEPLGSLFDGDYLHSRARGRRGSVKNFIMNGHIVVGVGNIYASEALYHAGIHPGRAAGRISRQRIEKLVDDIKSVLSSAITRGGTTLKDFTGSDGRPGYFAQELSVYGREGQTCLACSSAIRRAVIGQRASFYCPSCQR